MLSPAAANWRGTFLSLPYLFLEGREFQATPHQFTLKRGLMDQ
jgi:hypothetical protein